MAGPIEVQGIQITGPLAPFAQEYRVKLKERGYRPRSIDVELRHVARLSGWLEERQLSAADLSDKRFEEFFAELPRRSGGGRVCSRQALVQVLEVLDERGVERLEGEEAPASASEVLLASFERFLLQERAVSLSTVPVYLARARHFLAWCAPSGDVGEAIVAYLRRGRPKATEHREVFLRAVAPIGPFGTNGIAGVMRCACLRAGVPVIGPHRLRHTVASQMANGGVPLPDIAEVLRHRSICSTAEYARVDIEGLRGVAQPWPGGGAR